MKKLSEIYELFIPFWFLVVFGNEVNQNINSSTTVTATFNANSSIDNGNNSGVTFGVLIERNMYWIGGTGDWSDGSKWSLTSGGPSLGCPPSSADNLFFDQNSFSAANQTFKIDIDNAACKNITWAGRLAVDWIWICPQGTLERKV